MKASITLRLDPALLAEIRLLATHDGISTSAWLVERLEEIVRQRGAYTRARKSALARLAQGLDVSWTPPRSRDELHER